MSVLGRKPRINMDAPWQFAAWIAGMFMVLVGFGMLVAHVQHQANDPWKSPVLLDLKEQLRAEPKNEALKQNIRELDLQLRDGYFRRLSLKTSGAYLLAGGAIVLIIATTQLLRSRRLPPMPRPRPDAATQAAQQTKTARWAVAVCGSIVGAGLLLLSFTGGSALSKRTGEFEKLLAAKSGDATVATDAASLDELKQNWTAFRGVDGSGVSIWTNMPATWDSASAAGIAWRVPAPAPGFSSPIVWRDRLFFSTGDADKREVLCLDANTGRLLWREAVQVAAMLPPRARAIPESTGYAAATMATDGRRAYAIFANGDVAALSFDGKLVWAKNLGFPENSYGHATSLATWQDRLIVQLDQGDSDSGKSKLYALDGRTGNVVWQKPRSVGASWASPIVIDAAGKTQIITLTEPWVIANDAQDGAELWRVDCLHGEITPSPVFAGGLVLAASPMEKLVAIRPDGQGNVTKTHIAWEAEENMPDVTSPTSNGELVFTITTSGTLACFDVKDGIKVWEEDLEMQFHASPAIAGNRLYLFSQKGTAIVVEAAREFKELFRAEMDDEFHASPAFADGRIFLRGVKHVWCIGATAQLSQND